MSNFIEFYWFWSSFYQISSILIKFHRILSNFYYQSSPTSQNHRFNKIPGPHRTVHCNTFHLYEFGRPFTCLICFVWHIFRFSFLFILCVRACGLPNSGLCNIVIRPRSLTCVYTYYIYMWMTNQEKIHILINQAAQETAKQRNAVCAPSPPHRKTPFPKWTRKQNEKIQIVEVIIIILTHTYAYRIHIAQHTIAVRWGKNE